MSAARVLAVVRAKVPAGQVVALDTPLLGVGLLDSVGIMAVVEALESELGFDFPPALLVPERFATARTLADALAEAGVLR